ncbi:metallophosphoesterase family protein [Treponema sp.]|uniref:metallophosphoesterase family protein n=1 Tax=Treponema sp. TaxID=166 RepID=UPI00298E2395|nr:metallophosphoesterase family protein [Treponema sp.]MCR5613449.1 metallophosphoesterase family protein [Treponema sp.]
MKFLIISDMHGNTENLDRLDSVFKDVDGVLCAGDFAEFNKLKTAKPVLEKLVSKHESIFAVIGNCDEPDFVQELEGQDISVQKTLVFHDGFAIAGSGGGSIFTKTTPNERTEEDLLTDFEIVENSSDSCADKDGRWSNLIIISHNPPLTEKCDSPAPGVHAGSKMLSEFIKKRSPLLVVTGHIHEGAAIEKIEESTVVNPGSLAEGKYALAEFEKKEGEWTLKSAELKRL